MSAPKPTEWHAAELVCAELQEAGWKLDARSLLWAVDRLRQRALAESGRGAQAESLNWRINREHLEIHDRVRAHLNELERGSHGGLS